MKFEKLSNETRNVANNTEYWTAAIVGIFKLAIFGFYGFSFWIATIYIDHKMVNPNTGNLYTVGDLISVFISLNAGMFMVFGLNPNIQALVKAKVVGRMVFDVIDRKALISDNEVSIKSFNVVDKIRFENVTFKYPTAAENINNVLEEASFEIKAG
jgi:ABC-type multidrug transport system fused ATPase/permease subunit